MTPRFTKVHSLGNDYLLFDQREWGNIADPGSFVRRLCERRTGVGADGVLIASITDAIRGAAAFRIYNADGSEAEISGNGLRCAAAGLFFQGKVKPPRLIFSSRTGERECRLLKQENARFDIRVDMGAPRFASQDIPFDDGSPHERLVDYPLTVGRRVRQVTAVSMGNPHCVLFVDRFPAPREWHRLGSEIESHPFFPKRTNVEFVHVRGQNEIEVLFWERGVGETMSSGSGSSAAAVAAALKGLTDRAVKVAARLGELAVDWTPDTVFQSALAEIVFDGTPAWL